MKKVDVLFLYETRVRELENICLIKSELEKRGISVAVLNTWNNLGIKRPPYKAKVVVSHGMYHDGIYLFVKDFCGDVPKVVNMQCEQIGEIAYENKPESRYVLKGIAKQCMHICWGNRTYRRLRDIAGIDEKFLSLTGQVALDFCKKEFKGYYMSKEEIVNQYSIPENKDINLFISSFGYVNIPERLVEKDEKTRKFIEFSVNSFNGIISWFEAFLSDHDDQVIVYRPHPAEADNERLRSLEQKYGGRFKVISELSVKQWISIADRVYSWYSTSTAEAYMLGTPVSILRPVEIPGKLEISLFENARFITSYNEFLDTFIANSASSIDKEVFEDIYFTDGCFAYIRVADTIEKVLKDDSFLIKNPPTLPEPGFKQKAKQNLSNAMSGLAQILPSSFTMLDRFRRTNEVDEYTIERQHNNFASEEDIAKIQKKIENVMAQKA